MPSAAKFLKTFGLTPGSQYGGFELQRATSTHDTIERFREYQYFIRLIFIIPLGYSVKDLRRALQSQIEAARTAKTLQRPYYCYIDTIRTRNVFDQGDRVIVHLKGHAHRIN